MPFVICFALVGHANNIQVLVHPCQTRKKSEEAKSSVFNIILCNLFYGDIPYTSCACNSEKLASVTMNILQIIWCELNFHLDIVHTTKGNHTEQLQKVQIKIWISFCIVLIFLLTIIVYNEIIVTCNQDNYSELPNIKIVIIIIFFLF